MEGRVRVCMGMPPETCYSRRWAGDRIVGTMEEVRMALRGRVGGAAGTVL